MKYGVLILLTFSILCAKPAFAAPVLPDGAGIYGVYWGGFHVADIVIGTQQQGKACTVATHVRSYGLAKLVSGFRSDTEADFTCEALKGKSTDPFPADSITPQHYTTHFMLRKRERNIDLTYSKDGGKIIKDENNPPENRWKRPAVPQEMKQDVYDPLTLSVVARSIVRHAVLAGRTPESFVVALYDGRRRTDITFHYHGLDEDGLHIVEFTEVPVAGYTGNELKDYDHSQKKFFIKLDAEHFMPLRAIGSSTFGSAVIRLRESCETTENCLQKIDKE